MDLNRFMVSSLAGYLRGLVEGEWRGVGVDEIVPLVHGFVRWAKEEVLGRFAHIKKIQLLAQAMMWPWPSHDTSNGRIVELLGCFIALRLFDLIEMAGPQGIFDRVKQVGKQLYLSTKDHQFELIIRKIVQYLGSSKRIFQLRQFLACFQLDSILAETQQRSPTQITEQQSLSQRAQTKDYFRSFFHNGDQVNSNSLMEYTQKVIQKSKQRKLMPRSHKVIKKAYRNYTQPQVATRRRLRFMSRSSQLQVDWDEESPLVQDSK